MKSSNKISLVSRSSHSIVFLAFTYKKFDRIYISFTYTTEINIQRDYEHYTSIIIKYLPYGSIYVILYKESAEKSLHAIEDKYLCIFFGIIKTCWETTIVKMVSSSSCRG